MITNLTFSEIAILVDFLVIKEGFVENFREYIGKFLIHITVLEPFTMTDSNL